MLSDEEQLRNLIQEFPHRQPQIQQLRCFLTSDAPIVPALVVHGLEATGKTSIVKELLSISNVTHAFIECQECITGRHLLERTVSMCLDAVEQEVGEELDRDKYPRCENLSALVVHLQRMLKSGKRFILAFNDIDCQREAPQTLLPALARFNEVIPNLTIVIIVSQPYPRFLHRIGVPHIQFPPYTREEAIDILTQSPLAVNIDGSDATASVHGEITENDKWLWNQFCNAVYDSLAKNTARDIVSFRKLAGKLWKPFVEPVASGQIGSKDFSKLLVAKRALFQSEDMLVERIVPIMDVQKGDESTKAKHELPYYSKFLLCAAYLASYNPPRTDQIFFTKLSERKRRKKINVRAGRPPKHRKIPRRLLSPSPFTLERLLAIFRAILPNYIRPTVDLYTQLATLASLRLVIKSSAGADVLDAATAKWKVNVPWALVVQLGRSVEFEIENYMWEG